MKMNNRFSLIITTLLVFNVFRAWAQDPVAPADGSDSVESMPGMDHSQMNHDAKPEVDQSGATDPTPHAGHNMNQSNAATDSSGNMDNMKNDGNAMDHGSMSMQGGSAPPDARDPHAYSGGYDLSQLPMRHADHEVNFGLLRADRFESVHIDGDTFAIYDLQAGYGGALDRVMIKAEGDVDSGEIEEASTDLLWNHAVATFWNTQLGLRYDSGEGPDRSWLAAGIQGLAPYWFEVDATLYVGEEGRTAFNIEAEYELLLTQKLVLQPRIEADFHGKRDAERSLGAGLSGLAVGLRLRYEICREFAPYVGVERVSQYGGTADYIRESGADTHETQAVAGVRFWF